VRVAEGGGIKAAGYGVMSSVSMDPIEKKPLYHFLPGSTIFSVGGWGCNLRCVFCQNWSISQQFEAGGTRYSPETVIGKAQASGSTGIAYTYNEPLVGYEFVYDCAGLADELGLANVLVTNGYIEQQPAAELLPMISAMNIDIKSIDDAFYRKQCRGSLDPVLRFARQAKAAGCHVELTNLLIPGLNDDIGAIERLAAWIRQHLGESTPLHLSAYHPDYKLDTPATPIPTLERAYESCRESLLYVYLGNVFAGSVGSDTECPGCGATLVSRRGYTAVLTELADGLCAQCGRPADIITRNTSRT